MGLVYKTYFYFKYPVEDCLAVKIFCVVFKLYFAAFVFMLHLFSDQIYSEKEDIIYIRHDCVLVVSINAALQIGEPNQCQRFILLIIYQVNLP